MTDNITCCVVECERPLDQNYWDTQYQANKTGWDLGEIAPPLRSFFDTLQNKDLSILIPGCGNGYEASYLLEKGFTNLTVIDIAPTLVTALQKKFSDSEGINIILGDFFTHQGRYDLIVEQTFFCALPPSLRQQYVMQMHRLLKPEGILTGLLFDRIFENGPPFGGSKSEYEGLFNKAFHFLQFESCKNSVVPRANSELWIRLQKNDAVFVDLYKFEGVTCSGCVASYNDKFGKIPGVIHVNIGLENQRLLLVSTVKDQLENLENAIAGESNYKITKIN